MRNFYEDRIGDMKKVISKNDCMMELLRKKNKALVKRLEALEEAAKYSLKESDSNP